MFYTNVVTLNYSFVSGENLRKAKWDCNVMRERKRAKVTSTLNNHKLNSTIIALDNLPSDI